MSDEYGQKIYGSVSVDNLGDLPAPIITRRDYFAAAALQGVLSNLDLEQTSAEEIAAIAADAAEALLDKLDGRTPEEDGA